jgi:hypothetical protein
MTTIIHNTYEYMANKTKHNKLHEKSENCALFAIEVYNKTDFRNRRMISDSI